MRGLTDKMTRESSGNPHVADARCAWAEPPGNAGLNAPGPLTYVRERTAFDEGA
jgi:hypothetical protein